MSELTLSSKLSFEDLVYTDLKNEALKLSQDGVPFEVHNLKREGWVDTCQMLWVPSAERAGMCFGGDSVWTDASSIENAVERWNTDTMVP